MASDDPRVFRSLVSATQPPPPEEASLTEADRRLARVVRSNSLAESADFMRVVPAAEEQTPRQQVEEMLAAANEPEQLLEGRSIEWLRICRAMVEAHYTARDDWAAPVELEVAVAAIAKLNEGVALAKAEKTYEQQALTLTMQHVCQRELSYMDDLDEAMRAAREAVANGLASGPADVSEQQAIQARAAARWAKGYTCYTACTGSRSHKVSESVTAPLYASSELQEGTSLLFVGQQCRDATLAFAGDEAMGEMVGGAMAKANMELWFRHGLCMSEAQAAAFFADLGAEACWAGDLGCPGELPPPNAPAVFDDVYTFADETVRDTEAHRRDAARLCTRLVLRAFKARQAGKVLHVVGVGRGVEQLLSRAAASADGVISPDEQVHGSDWTHEGRPLSDWRTAYGVAVYEVDVEYHPNDIANQPELKLVRNRLHFRIGGGPHPCHAEGKLTAVVGGQYLKNAMLGKTLPTKLRLRLPAGADLGGDLKRAMHLDVKGTKAHSYFGPYGTFASREE